MLIHDRQRGSEGQRTRERALSLQGLADEGGQAVAAPYPAGSHCGAVPPGTPTQLGPDEALRPIAGTGGPCEIRAHWASSASLGGDKCGLLGV